MNALTLTRPFAPELSRSAFVPVAKPPSRVGAGAPAAVDSFVPASGTRAPPDGKAWLATTLEDIRARVANGEKVRVVFDIDDTLADNRGRTLALGKALDARNGTHYFDNATLSQMGKDAVETARNLKLPSSAARAFNSYWRQNFFEPATNQYDVPMQPIIDLAKAAKEAGAEVFYLTGRTNDGREGTRGELQRFGLPDADDAHLVMKPKASMSTPAYKAKQFGEWLKEPKHLSFFITESRRDIAAVQAAQPSVPCVLLDSAKEQGGVPVRPDTPVYPSVTGFIPRPRATSGMPALA